MGGMGLLDTVIQANPIEDKVSDVFSGRCIN